MEYKPGDTFVFETTQNDLSCMNGSKCRIVEKQENGLYKIEFIGATVSAWPEELKAE